MADAKLQADVKANLSVMADSMLSAITAILLLPALHTEDYYPLTVTVKLRVDCAGNLKMCALTVKLRAEVAVKAEGNI
jgi:hypothetical protein